MKILAVSAISNIIIVHLWALSPVPALKLCHVLKTTPRNLMRQLIFSLVPISHISSLIHSINNIKVFLEESVSEDILEILFLQDFYFLIRKGKSKLFPHAGHQIMHFHHITAFHMQMPFLSIFYEGKKSRINEAKLWKQCTLSDFLHSKGIEMPLKMTSISFWLQNDILQYGLLLEILRLKTGMLV